MIVYISAGNSDDRLPQQRWAQLLGELTALLTPNIWGAVRHVHGCWYSSPTSVYQGVCWCVELKDDSGVGRLRRDLTSLAVRYQQDAIAWAEAPQTTFLGPIPPTTERQAAWSGGSAA